MSLKTYIDLTTKDFLKKGTGDILFGLQNAPTFKLLPIYKAYKSGSSNLITEITAINISNEYPFLEKNRTILANDLIVFDVATNQYIIDVSKNISLTDGIYYLEFKNGFNIFETEAFLVSKMDYNLTFDMQIITFDSTLITFDKTKINI